MLTYFIKFITEKKTNDTICEEIDILNIKMCQLLVYIKLIEDYVENSYEPNEFSKNFKSDENSYKLIELQDDILRILKDIKELV